MAVKITEVYLQNVPQEKVFWCIDGRIIAGMEELFVALQVMSEETYRYHASAEKNDFSKWIREVVGDIILADQLETILSKDTAAKKVETRIKSLKSRKKK